MKVRIKSINISYIVQEKSYLMYAVTVLCSNLQVSLVRASSKSGVSTENTHLIFSTSLLLEVHLAVECDERSNFTTLQHTSNTGEA